MIRAREIWEAGWEIQQKAQKGLGLPRVTEEDASANVACETSVEPVQNGRTDLLRKNENRGEAVIVVWDFSFATTCRLIRRRRRFTSSPTSSPSCLRGQICQIRAYPTYNSLLCARARAHMIRPLIAYPSDLSSGVQRSHGSSDSGVRSNTNTHCRHRGRRRFTCSFEKPIFLRRPNVVGSGVFLDLARQNLGDADRVGYGVGGTFLALWTLHRLNLELLIAKHILGPPI